LKCPIQCLAFRRAARYHLMAATRMVEARQYARAHPGIATNWVSIRALDLFLDRYGEIPQVWPVHSSAFPQTPLAKTLERLSCFRADIFIVRRLDLTGRLLVPQSALVPSAGNPTRTPLKSGPRVLHLAVAKSHSAPLPPSRACVTTAVWPINGPVDHSS
jgi:hypothetical protein